MDLDNWLTVALFLLLMLCLILLVITLVGTAYITKTSRLVEVCEFIVKDKYKKGHSSTNLLVGKGFIPRYEIIYTVLVTNDKYGDFELRDKSLYNDTEIDSKVNLSVYRVGKNTLEIKYE